MDAIFGTRKTPELFSARNELLISSIVEEVFDSGKITIVAGLRDQPQTVEILSWHQRSTREYKLRIIDRTWDRLDRLIVPFTGMPALKGLGQQASRVPDGLSAEGALPILSLLPTDSTSGVAAE